MKNVEKDPTFALIQLNDKGYKNDDDNLSSSLSPPPKLDFNSYIDLRLIPTKEFYKNQARTNMKLSKIYL